MVMFIASEVNKRGPAVGFELGAFEGRSEIEGLSDIEGAGVVVGWLEIDGGELGRSEGTSLGEGEGAGDSVGNAVGV